MFYISRKHFKTEPKNVFNVSGVIRSLRVWAKELRKTYQASYDKQPLQRTVLRQREDTHNTNNIWNVKYHRILL